MYPSHRSANLYMQCKKKSNIKYASEEQAAVRTATRGTRGRGCHRVSPWGRCPTHTGPHSISWGMFLQPGSDAWPLSICPFQIEKDIGQHKATVKQEQKLSVLNHQVTRLQMDLEAARAGLPSSQAVGEPKLG